MNTFRFIAAAVLSLVPASSGFSQQIVGTCVVPHHYSSEMRWRRPPNPELSAKVDLFLLNSEDQAVELTADASAQFDGLNPAQLLGDHWAWHDTPSCWQPKSVTWPSGSMTVCSINGKTSAWGIDTEHEIQFAGGMRRSFNIEKPTIWISSITFLSVETETHETDSIRPNRIVVHLSNDGPTEMRLQQVRMWLPKQGQSHHVFFPERDHDIRELSCFPIDGLVAAGKKGGCTIDCEPLPLGYAVIELRVRVGEAQELKSIWAHLRVKRDVFDISGGWIASDVNGRNSMSIDEYLMTLQRMHINTGQIEEVGGYTDNPERYKKWPMKRFNRLWSLTRYDTDAMLPTIHAVEFLGEPQYGGGRPVPPQEVFTKLQPYQPSRLATSLTLSEEHSWRYYAGLSDFPHYDAYRVTAPAADSWRSYDRWDGEQIRWGAPLETVGSMTRSLREHSRPRPIAYWSQGAHDGWGSRWNPRRSSPTSDELRSQAWHGLANRITSLYWFNLSIKSLAKFPDLIEPITRVNREIRMLDGIFLTGQAFEYRRMESEGKPNWDITSIATPTSILLVAHDLRYRADPTKREFVFTKRTAAVQFERPDWLHQPLHVFRVDADGTHDVSHALTETAISISDEIDVVGVYIATTDERLRGKLDQRHAELLAMEDAISFDPVNQQADRDQLLKYFEE